MEWMAGLKWGLDLVGKAASWWFASKDPARKQASRMLAATRAHGLAPLQLPRLLPERLMLESKHLASSSSLADKVSVQLVDWFASEFALSSDWVELGEGQKHQAFHWYKRPGHLHHWLEERGRGMDGRVRDLHLITEASFDDPSMATGRFLLAYEEAFADIGSHQGVSRYWLLSQGLSFEHEPCVLDLLSAITIAESFGMPTRAHRVGQKILKAAEEGDLKQFLPELLGKAGQWRVNDWVPQRYLTENCLSDGHARLWNETLGWLAQDDLRSRLNLDRFSRH